MAKIPFDIKYRSQIKSGEYKVVCGNDCFPVTILMWDFKDPEGYNILGYYEDKEGQHPVMYNNNGKLYHDKEDMFDLFIITPGPELSEFEDRLRIICENAVKEAYFSPCCTSEDFAKNHAAELLDLARKELVKEGTSKNEMGTMLYDAGFEDGKAEALKDLPMWSPNDIYPELNDIVIGSIGTDDHFFIHRGRIIHLESLEKLPGFNE